MNDHIFWLLEADIKEGKYDDFKALMAEMVTATKANEPGAINYEWFINADNNRCHIYERYADSEAVLAHLGNFGSQFGGRFMSMIKITRFMVHGNPNEAAQKALASVGAQFMNRWGGFTR